MAGFGYGLPISRLVRTIVSRIVCVSGPKTNWMCIVCKILWWRFEADINGRVKYCKVLQNICQRWSKSHFLLDLGMVLMHIFIWTAFQIVMNHSSCKKEKLEKNNAKLYDTKTYTNSRIESKHTLWSTSIVIYSQKVIIKKNRVLVFMLGYHHHFEKARRFKKKTRRHTYKRRQILFI